MTTFETNAELVFREDITDELIVIRVQPDQEEFPSFVPGQYAELSIIEAAPKAGGQEKLVRKAYSIASSPGDPRGLEFYIALVAEGDLTPKLWKLNQGDRLWYNPKLKGKFTLDTVAPRKDLVLVATGTGIAPYVSMLRTYREDPPWRRLVVVHGVRYAQDLGYKEELEAMQAEDSRVFYIPVVSRESESSSWSGLRGRVQMIFQENIYQETVGNSLNPEDCQVMLCGNPQMIEEMQTGLEERGFRIHKKKNPGQIHFERYW